MNTLIIDDNDIARATIKQLSGKISDIQVAGECSNAADAYHFINNGHIDLLLLDVEMPGMSGIELTRKLTGRQPLIIFITSKKDYAAEAFDLNVVDYLLKPVTTARFIQAIDKARETLEGNRDEVNIKDDEFVFIRDSNVIRRLNLDDILYAEAMGDYVKLYIRDKFYAVHTTLKAVEERLPKDRFIRVHRSYMAALDKIDSVENGSLIIGARWIPVADAYRSAVMKRMNIL